MNTEQLNNWENWKDFALCEYIEANCNDWIDVSNIGRLALGADKHSQLNDIVSTLCASTNEILLRKVAKRFNVDIDALREEMTDGV